MAFTSKINSVINAVQNNLPNGIGGQISNFANLVTGQVQNNKIAAQLLNKSPLELDTDTPTSHMKENPFNYGTVYYPQEAGNMGDGHYVMFDILNEKSTSFKYTNFDGTNIKKLNGQDTFKGDIGDTTGASVETVYNLKQSYSQKRIRKPNSGFSSNFDRFTFISDTMLLYTPPTGLNFSYGMNYEGIETGILGVFTSGSVLDSIERGGGAAADAIARLGGAILDTATGGASTALAQQGTGLAFNPMVEQTFQGVKFREFTFEYKFLAKNEKEKDDIHKIINLFKFHMHPEFSNSNKSIFTVPSRFQVTYMYRDKENTYIPRVSRCVLTQMDVNYAAGDEVQSFKGDSQGAPMSNISVNLTFVETEIMTKETIAQGY